MSLISSILWRSAFAFLVLVAAAVFPVRATTLDRADRASARNDISHIVGAVLAFETEYGYIPKIKDCVVGGEFLAELCGENDALNPRKIVFIELRVALKGRGGLRDGVFVDPWGAPYKMVLDNDGDGLIRVAGQAPGPVASNLKRKVAVWNVPSTHPDNPSVGEQKRRAVESWN